jgi:hypothetical protein
MEVGHERGDGRLAVREAVDGILAGHPALGVEHKVDALHRLGGQRHAGGIGQLERLPSEVRPAGRLGDRPGHPIGRVELAEPGIGVDLQDPLPARQVPLRVLGRPVTREVEQ